MRLLFLGILVSVAAASTDFGREGKESVGEVCRDELEDHWSILSEWKNNFYMWQETIIGLFSDCGDHKSHFETNENPSNDTFVCGYNIYNTGAIDWLRWLKNLI